MALIDRDVTPGSHPVYGDNWVRVANGWALGLREDAEPEVFVKDNTPQEEVKFDE